MDPSIRVAPCIEANLSNLSLTTKCIKNSASSLLSVCEHAELIAKIWLQNFETGNFLHVHLEFTMKNAYTVHYFNFLNQF